MGISFIPWTISWIFIKHNLLIATLVPFILSMSIFIFKKSKNEVTFFEKSNLIYFLQLSSLAFFTPNLILEKGYFLNYISIGFIWLFSIFFNKPLTGEYSKFRFNTPMENNLIFIKTNSLMTLFWSILFFTQFLISLLLSFLNLNAYNFLTYALLLLGAIFTRWFPNWYPQHIAEKV